jgi:hypothetical protein
MACLTEHVLGLNRCRRFNRSWLRFDVIQDLLDYVWVSDVGDDAYGAATQWTQAIHLSEAFYWPAD